MAYDTHFTGEITTTPPLPWSAIRNSLYLPDAARKNALCLKFLISEETVETDDGTLVRREATAVLPIMEDPFRAYEIVEQFQNIVDTYGSGHDFAGYLAADGSDPGDLWRLAVVDGRATKIQPRIVWPDGTEDGAR